MKRMKVYDVPHKGLRNALSQLSLLAGKTDYTSTAEATSLYNLGADVFTLLAVHAGDENTVSLAELEARCPGCSQHDIDDHEALEAMQHKIEQLLGEIYHGTLAGEDVSDKGAEFYLRFSEFHGKYLEHTAEEERVTQPLLWQHFTDEELAGHRGRIMGRLQPQVLLTWFRFILPAQSHNERVGLLSGFKKMAPTPFYDQALTVIQQAMDAKEFESLKEALAN